MRAYPPSSSFHTPGSRWRLAAAACLSGFLSGCASAPPPEDRADTRGLERSERFVRGTQGQPGAGSDAVGLPARPAATVRGEPVLWEDLRPLLVELAGAQALEEAALDLLLADEARRAGVAVTADDLEAERLLYIESLTEASGDADAAARLLAEVRRQRGLGDARFTALLRRNALLRRLVQPEVNLTPAAIDQAFDLRYGERIPARIITVRTTSDAAAALDRLRAGERFADVAQAVSTDISAARGGRIEPVNPADPSYPDALRSALRALRPGEVSPVVALASGFVILTREPAPAPAPPPDINAVRPQLERDARLRQEGLLMGRLARRLLEDAPVTPLDPALGRAWRERREAPGR